MRRDESSKGRVVAEQAVDTKINFVWFWNEQTVVQFRCQVSFY